MNKKRKTILLLILGAILLVFIAFCLAGMYGSKFKRNTSYSLWFVTREADDNVFGYVDYAYTTTNSASQEDRALFHNILSQLTEQPKSPDLMSVFPDNTDIRGVSVSGKILRINFSSEFLEMSDYEMTLAKYCIAKTFSVFDDISGFSISVEGRALDNEDGGIYYIEEYITDHGQLHPRTLEITFYKLSEDGASLTADREKIQWYPHNSLPQNVVEMLLHDYAGGAIPQGTRLLSSHQTGTTVYLSFTPEFGSYSDTEGILAVYSVVNTVSSIPDVAYVVISLNGEKSSISGIPLDTPLLPDMSYVYTE